MPSSALEINPDARFELVALSETHSIVKRSSVFRTFK